MRCPDCGYEADNAAIFCPQCRFQFRDIIEEPAPAGDTIIDLPERGIIADESIYEEPRPEEERPKMFTDKELRQMDVQLMQPAVLIVLIVALFSYTVLYTVPFIPVSIAGLSFGITGIICLTCGVVAGIVFSFLARKSLAKFRYR